ncbi:unnamed protein product (macronuclear) [Paramecium tetraurelia]|uniref:RING-type E3 ubiquitin transferase n=1 Tax=Paramecium tetraurelia TaxID=5888 RepID=A0C2D3_PARTE|nr:uncharacterized protein GSPATT00034427001 [Paramecium tetraurelia]CAK64950.1 unnamed protein product [Paramecium tetraurelia]|eukprot:XP_001432347.1 hypothetical protein (macronuclear) [Paramecium tetraurelia strain d4-2]
MEQQLYQWSRNIKKQAHKGLQYLDQANDCIKDNTDQQKNKLKVLINQNLGKGKRMDFLILLKKWIEEVLTFKYLLIDVQSFKSILAELAQIRNVKLDCNHLEQSTQKKMLQDIPIPQSFTCVISYEIMNEPILFNTGQTYEKNATLNKLNRMRANHSINARLNLQLLQGINELKKYGWIGIEQEEDYKEIKFE